MFKKIYEDPVQTVEDVWSRGLIPIVWDAFYKDFLANSQNSIYQQLGNISVITPLNSINNWDAAYDAHLQLLKSGIQEENTHVYLTSNLWDDEKDLGRYHYSQERLEGELPYSQ